LRQKILKDTQHIETLHPSTVESPILMNNEICQALTRKAVALLLSHSGYQGVTRSTLDVLTDISITYWKRLTRILHIHIDNYSNKCNREELIDQTLHEVGATGVNSIKSYITDNLLRFGRRLESIKNKLQTKYDELEKNSTHT